MILEEKVPLAIRVRRSKHCHPRPPPPHDDLALAPVKGLEFDLRLCIDVVEVLLPDIFIDSVCEVPTGSFL
jgi:hypothetical protein